MRPTRTLAAALTLLLAVAALAAGQAGARTVHYAGRAVEVPRGWDVVRLAGRPHACLRLDRRAVYLGHPGPEQRCPSQAVGRRAIVVAPPPAARAGTSAVGPPVAAAPAGGEDYVGLGFDACAAPSSRTMAAWAKSPYRAIGVYVGGLNRGCSQPNLTEDWVAEQVAAGWHLIPTYVGLQAPTSACGSCAKLSGATASIQGRAAARDAVADAQAVGIGAGAPIYFDMEAYTRTTSAIRATMTFLAAWTEQLHALGYVSGVYSSSGSGIADLARQPRGYSQPDAIWHANWNGARDTADPYFSASLWTDHQRIHQYRGGHNETWGGATINIDNDYVDGPTFGGGERRPPPPPLTVKHVRPQGGTVRLWVRCGWDDGESCPGRIILRTQARLPLRARRGAGQVPRRLVRVGVSHRAFRLGGGRAHTYRIALNRRGRQLFRLRRGSLRAQLLVAIPGSRALRPVRLRR